MPPGGGGGEEAPRSLHFLPHPSCTPWVQGLRSDRGCRLCWGINVPQQAEEGLSFHRQEGAPRRCLWRGDTEVRALLMRRQG